MRQSRHHRAESTHRQAADRAPLARRHRPVVGVHVGNQVTGDEHLERRRAASASHRVGYLRHVRHHHDDAAADDVLRKPGACGKRGVVLVPASVQQVDHRVALRRGVVVGRDEDGERRLAAERLAREAHGPRGQRLPGGVTRTGHHANEPDGANQSRHPVGHRSTVVLTGHPRKGRLAAAADAHSACAFLICAAMCCCTSANGRMRPWTGTSRSTCNRRWFTLS